MGTLVRCRLLGGIAMEDRTREVRGEMTACWQCPLLLHQDRPPYASRDIPSAELKDIEDFLSPTRPPMARKRRSSVV